MKKSIFLFPIVLIGVLVIAFIALFIKQAVLDNRIDNDISSIYADKSRQPPVSVNGIGVIKQEISCGYACIELLAKWQGKSITEATLLDLNNGKITTAMGNGFVNEANKQFAELSITKYSNLTNTELLNKVYDSLANGKPVPFEFAALMKTDDTNIWTLHFAIITGMDIENDCITISNPYGYLETYTLEDFLRATRYESYENMEFYFKLGFTAGIFNKNTIYLIQ